MSFILEALRKSEHERQRQAGPIVANPYATPRRAPFALPVPWIVGIAALLAINLVVILVLVFSKDAPPSAAPALPLTTVETITPPLPPENPVEQLQARAPLTGEPAAIPAPEPIEPPLPPDTRLQAPPETQAAIQPPAPTRSIPTINELNLQGVHALPALHMDIHVYATQPADRFIFLNSRKYREGAQTPEGITIERITPEGAILNRNGLQFLLPRP